jgi:hypothetical protein
VEQGRLGDEMLHACFNLIEMTSRRDYANSRTGWRPAHKLEEMKTAGLRYVLVLADDDTEETGGAKTSETETDADVNAVDATAQDQAEGENAPRPMSEATRLKAFTSAMADYEEGCPVVYCYEIHLVPELQG